MKIFVKTHRLSDERPDIMEQADDWVFPDVVKDPRFRGEDSEESSYGDSWKNTRGKKKRKPARRDKRDIEE